MSLKTNSPCLGRLNHLKCPYQTLSGSQTCRIHQHKMNIYRFTMKPKVSWIEKHKTGMCHVCTNEGPIIGFDCNIHYYCPPCYKELVKSDNCPLCLSLKEWRASN